MLEDGNIQSSTREEKEERVEKNGDWSEARSKIW